MLAVHSPLSLRHDPERYFRRGAFVEHPERAERYEVLHGALARGGHELVAPERHGLDPALAVHTPAYVDFLRGAWDRRAEIAGGGPEILPSHFARPHMAAYPGTMLGLVGFHMADTSTPIREGTWAAIGAACDVTVTAADAVAAGRRMAYALARPPGHHAYADSAGGFCFLNNSAIAAERLRAKLGGKIAILDIDVHHGNGTQGIFYARDDVLTISIHADPTDYFPFYAGFPKERGSGAGEGFNRNLALPQGTPDAPWLDAIRASLEEIAAFGPSALVVALGFDASEDDPIGAFKVTTDGFARAAELIGSAGLPTLLVQEGGYLCPALPRNLEAFLAAAG
jgi:acetoin utilization deacetylase AcuC-like enzyme